MGLKHWKFPREKTAIHHPNNLSVAASRGIKAGIIKPCSIILDYGCGYGDDVRQLKMLGYHHVTGWDPRTETRSAFKAITEMYLGIYLANACPRPVANVVILSNVINVIEDPEERHCVLLDALSRATECLIVTAYNGSSGKKWGDGVVTRMGTFQKPYSKAGFRRVIQGTLGKVCKKIEWHPHANLAFVWKKEVPGP